MWLNCALVILELPPEPGEHAYCSQIAVLSRLLKSRIVPFSVAVVYCCFCCCCYYYLCYCQYYYGCYVDVLLLLLIIVIYQQQHHCYHHHHHHHHHLYHYYHLYFRFCLSICISDCWYPAIFSSPASDISHTSGPRETTALCATVW